MPVVVKLSESYKFIVCTLSKKNNLLQQPLQLVLNPGDNVTFELNCKQGSVNLSGYYMNEDAFGDHEHDDCGEVTRAGKRNQGKFQLIKKLMKL